MTEYGNKHREESWREVIVTGALALVAVYGIASGAFNPGVYGENRDRSKPSAVDFGASYGVKAFSSGSSEARNSGFELGDLVSGLSEDLAKLKASR